VCELGTIDNPDITIQYYDASISGWVELFDETLKFRVRDGGLRRSPVAEVTLINPESLPNLYDLFRINVDVRGVQDQIFYGRVFDIRRILTPGSLRVQTEISAFGLEAAKLNRDTITKDYQDEQDARYPETLWTFKNMIIDFLDVPDSGYAVWGVPATKGKAYRLDTDTGAITSAIYGQMNFDHETLLDALRRVAEFLAYDGYVYIDAADYARIKFVQVGTLAANPAIILEEPFLDFRVKYGLRGLINYVLVRGGADVGVPYDGDRFTERGVSKWNGLYPAWTNVDPDTTLSDDSTRRVRGKYSIKMAKTTGSDKLEVKLNFANAGYSPMPSFRTRIRSICFSLFPSPTNLGALDWIQVLIGLKDSAGNRINTQSWGMSIHKNEWNSLVFPLPQVVQGKVKLGDWWFETGSSFDFENVTDFYFSVYAAGRQLFGGLFGSIGSYALYGDFYLDSLLFRGGKEIIPDTLNPPVKNDSSISNYGVSVYWLFDRDINSFDMAQYEGQRILKTLSEPSTLIEATKRSYTWARPSQVLTVNVPRLGISNESWRILEIIQRWNRTFPQIRTTFQLCKSTIRTPPPWRPTRGDVPPEPFDWDWDKIIF